MEARQASKETPLPERLLKNVNDFPTYSEGTHKKGYAALLNWPHEIHAIYKNNKTTWELYDLDKDPMESKDLSPTFAPQKLERLKEKLTTWQKSVLRSHEGKDYR